MRRAVALALAALLATAAASYASPESPEVTHAKAEVTTAREHLKVARKHASDAKKAHSKEIKIAKIAKLKSRLKARLDQLACGVCQVDSPTSCLCPPAKGGN